MFTTTLNLEVQIKFKKISKFIFNPMTSNHKVSEYFGSNNKVSAKEDGIFPSCQLKSTDARKLMHSVSCCSN